MLTRAFNLLFVLWTHPSQTAIAIILFCIAGVATYAGRSWLAGRRDRQSAQRASWLSPVLLLVAFFAADWALLRALPLLRLSFAITILAPLIAITLVRLLVFWSWAGAVLIDSCLRRRRARAQARGATVAFVVANVLLSVIQVDAYVVEPLLLKTTELTLEFDDLDPAARPARIVQIADLHVERSSYREAAVIERVNALRPDIIVLTGDYLNLSRLSDPVSAAHFRRLVEQLDAPYGIYAVRGTVEPTPASMSWLVEGTAIRWLEQEKITVDVRGQKLTLVGVACSHQETLDAARLAQAMGGVPDDAFTLLLYHSPDLIMEAAAHRVDLYLGGHTHGGQLRLPLYGAIATGSRYGRRFVAGLFEVEGTRMYISQGMGLEGGGMPRARFLCRPELVSLDLVGS